MAVLPAQINVTVSNDLGQVAATIVPVSNVVINAGQQGLQGIQGEPGPSGGSLTAVTSVNLLTLGNLVVVQSDGTLALADPTNASHARLLMGLNTTTGRLGTSVDYLPEGEAVGLSGFTTGSLYFAGLSGVLSTIPEAAGAAWLRAIGNANSATSFVIDKQTPILLSS